MEDRITDVTFRIRRGPWTRPLVVHADRLWRYYGPGTFTWGGLADAEDSNSDGGELGSSSSTATTDDEDVLAYATGGPSEEALAPLGSLLVQGEDTTGDQRAGATDDTDQEQEAVGEGRPRRTRRVPRWTADFVMGDSGTLTI